MFEDSLFASSGDAFPVGSRWTTTASMGIQAAVIGVVVLLPLLRTAVLPVFVDPPAAVVFHAPVPPPPMRARVTPVSTESSVSLAPAGPVTIVRGRGVLSQPGTAGEAAGDGPSLMAAGTGMGMTGGGTGLEGIGGGESPSVRVAPAGKMRVSEGVSAGMLLNEMRPVYPPIALAAGVSGIVVVTATIDKMGRIVGAQAVSGPMMLRGAALDAVRAARYRPYLLNGEAVEVETTVSVNFRRAG